MARRRFALLIACAAVAACALVPSSASAAPTLCTQTVNVSFNERIGPLVIPRGSYTLYVQNPSRLSCTRANTLIRTWLNDWQAPTSWDVDPAWSTFTQVSDPARAFGLVRRGTTPPPPNPNVCPGSFQVLHNDVIGPLSFPAGFYKLIRLNSQSPTCAQVASLFRQFLNLPSGRLPSPWVINPRNGTFTRRGG